MSDAEARAAVNLSISILTIPYVPFLISGLCHFSIARLVLPHLSGVMPNTSFVNISHTILYSSPYFLEEQAFVFDGKEVTSLVALTFARQSIPFTDSDKSTSGWRVEG